MKKYKTETKLNLICSFSVVFLFILFILSSLLLTNSIADASTTSASKNGNSELYDKLSKIEGVHDINEITTKDFKEKYIFKITQPLDWKNPNSMKFDQRVIISFNGFDKYNVIETEGYNFTDALLKTDKKDEFVEHYFANQINIEHRFFGESIPKGLNNKDTKYWEYLTTENEAYDTHKIYTELSKIFKNKWIASGASKGGETTMLYGYYFPNDMDLLVPYVAPWCEQDDKRAYDFIWNKAGDEKYGKQKAAEYRQLMDDIMVDFYTHRDDIRDRFINERVKDIFYVEDVFKERTVKIMYDEFVLFVPFTAWQYKQNFEEIEKIHNLSWETQHDEKVEELLNLISSPKKNKLLEHYMRNNINGDDIESPHYAYRVQAWREEGNYYCDIPHLQNLIKEKGITTGLEIKPGEETHLIEKIAMHKNFADAFPYESKTHENVIKWWNSTNQKIIAIYGSSDPWYSLRINDINDKDNIKIFVSNKEAHGAKIKNLPESQIDQAWATLDKWLTEKKEPVVPPTPEPVVNPSTNTEPSYTSAKTLDENYVLILFIITAFLMTSTYVAKKKICDKKCLIVDVKQKKIKV